VSRYALARLLPSGVVDTGFNPVVNGSVRKIADTGSDGLVLGGDFSTVGGATLNRLARLSAYAGFPASVVITVTDESGSAAAAADLAVATPSPATPTGLTASPGAGSLTVSWTAPAGPVTDYTVQYRTSPSGAWTTVTDGMSLRSTIMITGLTGGTAYEVRVAAVNLTATGAWSATVTATPTP
jgi:hypothetical protein